MTFMRCGCGCVGGMGSGCGGGIGDGGIGWEGGRGTGEGGRGSGEGVGTGEGIGCGGNGSRAGEIPPPNNRRMIETCIAAEKTSIEIRKRHKVLQNRAFIQATRPIPLWIPNPFS